jgi:hypothetical protein
VFNKKIPHRHRFGVKICQAGLLGPVDSLDVFPGTDAALNFGIFKGLIGHMVLMHDVDIGGLGQVGGHPAHKFLCSGYPVGHH